MKARVNQAIFQSNLMVLMAGRQAPEICYNLPIPLDLRILFPFDCYSVASMKKKEIKK